jgi:tRNA pseudouridine55 synthase
MARRRKGREVDGIILLNKPQGLSSNQALQRVKHLYFAQKAGHTGSLDPMATGILPICIGEATKFSQYLLDSDKAYEATIELGIQTTTGDVEGDVLEVQDTSAIDEAALLEAIASLRGFIDQTPPMYSAIKQNGQPLYKLARQGIEVERKSRRIEIQSFDLIEFTAGAQAQLRVYVKCSKGTYIRTLAEDLAEKLGVGAHLSRLHRVLVGQFDTSGMVDMQQLIDLKGDEAFDALDNLLIPAEVAVNHLPLVEVSETSGYYVRLGQPVQVPNAPIEGLVRIKQECGKFLGVGEVLDDGRIGPRRLIAS